MKRIGALALLALSWGSSALAMQDAGAFQKKQQELSQQIANEIKAKIGQAITDLEEVEKGLEERKFPTWKGGDRVYSIVFGLYDDKDDDSLELGFQNRSELIQQAGQVSDAFTKGLAEVLDYVDDTLFDELSGVFESVVGAGLIEVRLVGSELPTLIGGLLDVLEEVSYKIDDIFL